jgi:phosphatidylinositol glycan class F
MTSRAETKHEFLLRSTAVGTVVGAWLGAVPMPLDSDKPWQVWPISCTYGALLGYLLGLVGSWAWMYLFVGQGKPHKESTE